MAKMTKELPCFLSQIAKGFVRYEVRIKMKFLTLQVDNESDRLPF